MTSRATALLLLLLPTLCASFAPVMPRAAVAGASAARRSLAVRLEADTAAAPDATPAGSGDASINESINEPFSEMELAEQEAKLTALSEKWSKFEEQVNYEETMRSGFGPSPERINGRVAMFFLVTGLITEYYTGQSMPQQVRTQCCSNRASAVRAPVLRRPCRGGR